MKYISIFILLINSTAIFSQQTISIVDLGNGITITGTIEKFNSVNHNIDTCENNPSYKYICKIDGQKWYGSDVGLELPRNQLTSLKITIDNIEIPLSASGVYNPAFSYELSKNQFKLKKDADGYILYSYFSDGAGTYTVYWKINGNNSNRILISNNEEDFFWQLED